MPFGDAQRQDKEGQALPTHAHAKSLGGVLTAPGTQDPFAPAAQVRQIVAASLFPAANCCRIRAVANHDVATRVAACGLRRFARIG